MYIERITGHTQLLTLMAYPIRHSKSPEMHNEAAAYLGLDYAYLSGIMLNVEWATVRQIEDCKGENINEQCKE